MLNENAGVEQLPLSEECTLSPSSKLGESVGATDVTDGLVEVLPTKNPLSKSASHCMLTPSSKRHCLFAVFALILVGRTTTLVTSVALNHWNVGLGFDCLPGSACDADDSDVAAAAILQALSCGSALGSPRSSAHVLYLRFRCYRSTYRSWRMST